MHTTCCCPWPRWKNKPRYYSGCCTAEPTGCRPWRCRCSAPRRSRPGLSFRTFQHLGQEPRWPPRCRSPRAPPWSRWGNKALGTDKAEREAWTRPESRHETPKPRFVRLCASWLKSPKATGAMQTVSLVPGLLLTELIQYPSFQIYRGRSNV